MEVKSKLTPQDKHTLCCYLSDENIIYEYLIRMTVNLNDKRKTNNIKIFI